PRTGLTFRGRCQPRRRCRRSHRAARRAGPGALWLSSLVAGFVAGSLMLAADILATGAVTIGFGGYVRHLLGTPLIGNALGLIAVMGVILYYGVVQSGAIAIVLTVMEAEELEYVIVI